MSLEGIHGLILAGGSSTRMNRDKASLEYRGKTQLDRAAELARRHVGKVFVSVRTNQTLDPTRAQYPMIVDAVEGKGPIVGIRSALAAHPRAAWLVLACDLPFLSDAAVEALLRARDPKSLATAYTSVHDGLPEPLCAVWEPSAAPALADYQAGGGQCPRKFLIRHGARLLEPVDARALDNVNTPEEYAQATATLETSAPMQLKIQYYALMREQAGRSEEILETAAATPADLYTELAARHGFTLTREQLKVAVNSEFSEWSRKLAANDAVVFIPPVAGG
ncbi:MAG TPA: NTP transferase domain-containing protein [Steroidobacteraceae bacterium]|jgi:molybdopterin-guanine dinucleotide biosynthesis protein A|nr:NTP transferase domain-containing protein [Steroidobacteraceae bacterium]